MRTFAADFKKIVCEIRLRLSREQVLCIRLALILTPPNGQSCTASSLGIPQDGNIARVLGCSGAMQTAAHPPL